MQISTLEMGRLPDFEVIERKGIGHPDSLADGLAEEMSRAYSRYTRARFGAVLHHNFDKVGLLGGRSEVFFGRGRLTKPIRLLINGRISAHFGDEKIPFRELIEEVAQSFLGRRLPKLDVKRDLEFHWNLSTGSSPGQVGGAGNDEADRNHWFAPRSLKDLRELKRLACNDTSVGVAHAPFTAAERFVLALERELNGDACKRRWPWLGSDIKTLATRIDGTLDVTMCLPQIADEVPDLATYQQNLELARELVYERAAEMLPGEKFILHTNTRDDYKRPEIYLTTTGSSIESGDEGLVGRGNRPNGLISTCRAYSMEGVCGKNPVYYTGKVYSVAAQRIADKIAEASGSSVGVWVMGQSGRDLDDPWRVVVGYHDSKPDSAVVKSAIDEVMSMIQSITGDLLEGQVSLY